MKSDSSGGSSRPACSLTERGRGVLGKLLLGGLRPLDLEFVEQKRRARDAEPDGLRAVFDGGRGSGGDEIAAQRADVEISEDAAAHEFFMRVFGLDAIEEPGLESRSHGFHVESVGQVAVLAKFDQLCLEAGVRLGISRLQRRDCRDEARALQWQRPGRVRSKPGNRESAGVR